MCATLHSSPEVGGWTRKLYRGDVDEIEAWPKRNTRRALLIRHFESGDDQCS